jgi:Conjugative transposon protein TcpC
MVRGPKSGDGVQSSVYSLGSGLPDLGQPGAWALGTQGASLASDSGAAGSVVSAMGGTWSGAGGRWLLWPLRAVLWATLLIVAYRGMTAIFFSHAASPPGGGAGVGGAPDEQFPAALAEAYAADFGRVYLNFSPANASQREQALAAFVPASVASAHPDLGWSGTGQMSLQSEQVAGIAVRDAQHAVVNLLAMVNGQLMELGVPVVASGGEVVIGGEPAWLPAPRQAPAPPAAAGPSDPVAHGQLMNELPAFFQAYASGDSTALGRFSAPGGSLTGLNGQVAFDSIARLQVPPGGTTRQITVTVIWQMPGQVQSGGVESAAAKLAMTYRMSVVDLQSGKWYVNEISA